MTDTEIAIEELHQRLDKLVTPGDGFGVDPLIKRGELLERTAALRPLTTGERDELESIKHYAQTRLKHLRLYPLANTSQEESAQDLAEEQARDAANVERIAGRVVELLLQAGTVALKR